MTQEQIEEQAYEEYHKIQLSLLINKQRAKALLRSCEREADEMAKPYRKAMGDLILTNPDAVKSLSEEVQALAKKMYEPYYALLAEIEEDQKKSDELFRVWNHLPPVVNK